MSRKIMTAAGSQLRYPGENVWPPGSGDMWSRTRLLYRSQGVVGVGAVGAYHKVWEPAHSVARAGQR